MAQRLYCSILLVFILSQKNITQLREVVNLVKVKLYEHSFQNWYESCVVQQQGKHNTVPPPGLAFMERLTLER